MAKLGTENFVNIDISLYGHFVCGYIIIILRELCLRICIKVLVFVWPKSKI